jgi:hypothetical protein
MAKTNLRPINYKKADKVNDKSNLKKAKADTKELKKTIGKKEVMSVRAQQKKAKSGLKMSAVRAVVTNQQNKDDGDTRLGGRNDKRSMRTAMAGASSRESAKKAGVKTKTARKVYAKAYKAADKKVSKANKGSYIV